MNLGELKARLEQRTPHVGRSEPQGPSKEDGVRQTTDQQQNAVTLTNAAQSQRFMSLKIFSNALSQSLLLDDRRPSLPVAKPQDNKSLFDFEEVAKNVLRFVGGAIRHAQSKGMDDEKLTEMFEQARSGVLKGVQMAEKDLAGFMNEEISTGIKKSRELIEDGIKNLENEIFGNKEEEDDQIALRYTESVSYSRQDSSELTVRTRDGDEVTISFDDLRQFELNRSLVLRSQAEKEQAKDNADAEKTNSTESDEDESSSFNVRAEQRTLFYQKNEYGFSVKGELDEEELKAIGDLVDKTADLADEFFNGDVEKAFEQALKLGFDETELTGYALQLSRQEQTRVTQTYEAVQHGDDKFKEMEGYAKQVSHYLDKMLDMVEQSRQKLQDDNSFDNLINGLVNRMLDVDTPDLLQAINKFHSFNQRLLDNLPDSQATADKAKPESKDDKQ
ncbi:DUF5610 domain-containing protein [Bowmanella denitrificans]|uniref:DUF5610 domain-containing protein n=1 Tax=Bowmanella denitrificans TaxID=366582 RepID=UPI000C9AD803|nr:DUF5610 domain-containing protein [Bowmanella denitrificans]